MTLPGARRSPYQGLTPYTEADAAFFFGRTRERRIISANLLGTRLTLLYGETGVGKSSVLRAGVVEQLRELQRRNAERRESPELAVVPFSSWSDPVDSLRDAVLAAGADSSAATLEDAIAATSAAVGGYVLLILDQFEEYFVYHADGNDGFDAELPRLVNRPDLRVHVLVSIREDALAKLDRFKGRIPSLFDNYLRLEHLSRVAARAAIEKPVEMFNELLPEDPHPVAIEPALVDAVLTDLEAGRVVIGESAVGVGAARDASAEARIETPYLQLVMSRLWLEEEATGSRVLRLETLERLGGAERIVRSHVDEAMAAFDEGEQDVAARIFHHLVTPSGMKIAHSVPDLAALAEQSEETLEPVLAKLAGPGVRILRPATPPLGGPGARGFEIFHDVLAQAVLDWRARRVRMLEDRRREEERRAVEAARRRDLRHRFLRLFALLLLVCLIAATFLGLVALSERGSARRERRIAESRALAASALTQLPFDPELSALLALRALDEARTTQAVDALRQALPEVRVRTVMDAGRGSISVGPDRSAITPRGRLVAASSDGTAEVRAVATGRLVRRFAGHKRRLNAALFSPDGSLVATASEDRTARIWSVRTGQLVHVLRGHAAPVKDAAFSRDGRFLVTAGGRDRTARIWSVASGRMLRVLKGHRGAVTSAVFDPSGRRVLTASWDQTARIWDARSGRVVGTLRGHADRLADAVFSSDGRRIATASWDATARLWDARTYRTIAVLAGGDDQIVAGASFSRDGRRLATYGGSTARVWDGRTGSDVSTLEGHSLFVTSAKLSPDATLVVTGAEDGTARVWDAATGKAVLTLRGHQGVVNTATFTPSGDLVVTGASDHTVRTWSVGTGTVLRGHKGWVTYPSFDRNGSRVATSSADATVRIWDVRSGRAVRVLRGHRAFVNTVKFSSDGTRLVSASADSTARIWDARTGGLLRVLQHPSTEFVSAAAFDPGGTRVATVTDNRRVRIWDARTGRVIRTLRARNPLYNVSFNPRGDLVAACDAEGATTIWNVVTGRRVTVVRQRGGVYGVHFSPDGRSVATAGEDTTVRVWSVPRGRLLRVLRGHTSIVYDAVFANHGRWIVSVGDATRVWDVSTGEPLAVLHMHGANINGVDISRSGLIATASDDGTARLYRCATCGSVALLRALAERRVTRGLTPPELKRFIGGR